MATLTSAGPTPEEAAELEAAIDQMIAEIDELRAVMARDHVEIERLKRESDHLKMKSLDLQAETRLVLAQLKSRIA